MKQRPSDGGGGAGRRSGEGGDSGKKRKPWIQRKRNEQRLGAKGGLSLEAFANAKSKPTGYNPTIIKKQREFYKNAKLVNKYKKVVKQQSQQNNERAMISDNKDFYSPEDLPTPSNKRNRKNVKWSLKEDYERKHAEDEKEKMEREVMMQAKRKQIEQAESSRKALKKKMLTKTRSGQPRMKFRIEHMLESLAGSYGK